MNESRRVQFNQDYVSGTVIVLYASPRKAKLSISIAVAVCHVPCASSCFQFLLHCDMNGGVWNGNFITSGPGAWVLRFIQFNLKSASMGCCAVLYCAAAAAAVCSDEPCHAHQPFISTGNTTTLTGKKEIECEPKRHVIKNCLQSSLTRAGRGRLRLSSPPPLIRLPTVLGSHSVSSNNQRQPSPICCLLFCHFASIFASCFGPPFRRAPIDDVGTTFWAQL